MTTTIRLPLAITSVLLLLLVAMPAHAAATGSITVADTDGDTALIIGDSLRVTVTDADLNIDAMAAETTNVNVKSSTADTTGITLTLTETGVNTGVFEGIVTLVSTTSNSANRELQVAVGNTVTATYNDGAAAGGGMGTVTATDVVDQAGSTGSIAVADTDGDAALVIGDSLRVTVTDADLNTDTGLGQTVDVNVASSTDAAGIAVTLTETGLDTGVFEGTVTLVSGMSDAAADDLQVTVGDTVTATYDDDLNADGINPAAVTASRTVDQAGSTGSIAVADTDGDAALVIGDSLRVTVTDADLNTDTGLGQTVDVTVASSTDAAGIAVTLTETGLDTGVFEGTVTLVSTASNAANDQLQVAVGNTVTATYDDDLNADGINPAAVTASRTVDQAGSTGGGGGTTGDTGDTTTTSDGGTASTGDDATASDPVQTSVTTPTGGTVTIATTTATTTDPVDGLQMLSLEADIDAPDGTVDEPLELAFQVDASLLTDTSTDRLTVLRNGVPVARCTGDGARPDPCVASVTVQADGDVVIDVRTSQASVWNVVSVDTACPVGLVADLAFGDVATDGVHADAIACAAWAGLVDGFDADTFMPSSQVTRGQAALVLVDLLEQAGVTLPAGEGRFTDVAGAVGVAAESLAAAGVLEGTSSTTFEPQATLTRGELAALLVAVHELAGGELPVGDGQPFDDVDGIFATEIAQAAELGLTFGFTATTYQPAGEVTRGEYASFVTRLLDLMVRLGIAEPTL